MLFHYRSVSTPERLKYFFDLLSHGSLKFAMPCEFNDPFDCCPTALTEVPDDAFPHAVGDVLNRGHQAAMSRLVGVFCLTPHPDRMLMWSHYGDQHRGSALDSTRMLYCGWRRPTTSGTRFTTKSGEWSTTRRGRAAKTIVIFSGSRWNGAKRTNTASFRWRSQVNRSGGRASGRCQLLPSVKLS